MTQYHKDGLVAITSQKYPVAKVIIVPKFTKRLLDNDCYGNVYFVCNVCLAKA